MIPRLFAYPIHSVDEQVYVTECDPSKMRECLLTDTMEVMQVMQVRTKDGDWPRWFVKSGGTAR